MRRKTAGFMPGVGWGYILRRVLPVSPPAYQKNREMLSRLVASVEGIETFATPWGQFCLPKPGKEVLDSLLEEIFVLHSYENTVVSVREGEVVVGRGAHVGVFARLAFQQGAARVVCIEMDDLNVACLQQNLAAEKQCSQTIQTALWRKAVTLNFFPDQYFDCHRVSENGRPHLPKDARTLDDVLASLSVPRVDFIKVDVEGAESETLEGGLETIRRHRPKIAVAVYHEASERGRIYRLFDRHSLHYMISPPAGSKRSAPILFGKPAEM